MDYRLSLIIPVFNEVGNILPLVESIAARRDENHPIPFELVLVNNGSRDDSAGELEKATTSLPWAKVVNLVDNVGYGGGIQAGFREASPQASHIAWLPADRQYSTEDLHLVWREVERNPEAVHKGIRLYRLDADSTKLVSRIYTALCRSILGLKVTDINGLPKIFPAWAVKKMRFGLAPTFLLDGQMLLAAQKLKLAIYEHPVVFYARRAGVSSWSSKRLHVYWRSFIGLWKTRFKSTRWFS